MFSGAGEAVLAKELLFTLEVHLGEFDEALELNADTAAISTANEHDPQVVECVHQDAVLVVHGFDTDDALVTPSQKRHIHLHAQPKSSFRRRSLNDANVV